MSKNAKTTIKKTIQLNKLHNLPYKVNTLVSHRCLTL